MKNSNILHSRLICLKERYCKFIPQSSALLKLISEAEIPENVYNSNAIENSTLSLEETEKILLQIDLDRFISERELFEAKNLARVVTYLEEKSVSEPFTAELILLLHKMLISNIQEDIAGRFRKENDWVRVGTYIASDPKNVPVEINQMISDFIASSHKPIIERIAKLHLVFEHIHPFVDGNGRIGRVINNFLLLREGMPPINIKFTDRSAYYQAFKEFELTKQTTLMQEIIGKALINSFHKRLAYLERKQILTLSEYAKLTKQSHSNLLNKANRQTIEAFTEKGIWKIGI
jgi:Fic family protein